MKPDQVVAGSGAKAWWLCPAGPDHEWEATLDKRTRAGSGCPRCNKGWTVSALRTFVEGIRPHLATLSPAELWTLCMQNGLLTSMHSNFGRLIVSGRLTDSDLDDFLTTGDLDDIQGATESDSLLDDLVTFGDTALDLLDALEHHPGDLITGALPEVSIADVLASSALLLACADSEAAEYLVAARVALLWKAAYRDAARTDMETSAPLTDPYQERIRAAFRAEFDAALALPVPTGWRFTVNGQLASPNLMQRHVAVQVRDRRSVGNWSGTGAGKTVSAVLAARSISSNLTVIVCPNSTITGWTDTITRCFPDQRIISKTLTPTWTAGTGPQWLIVNYETLQAPDAEAKLVTFLDTHTIDMLVIDEVHFAKQRASQEEASTRRRRLNGLRSLATVSNPALAVLAMSATPVVNDLFEGRSMLELVEGVELNDVRVNPTIQNAVGIHQRLVRAGTRWMPEYASQLTITEEIIDAVDYVDDVRTLGKTPSPSDLDKALLPAKLETIVQHATAGGKTLIYSEFVTGIVEPLREALEAAGLRVGEYTGTDKTGFDKFVGYHLIGGRQVPIVEGDQVDVLIGSSAVGTGVDGLQHAANRLIFATLPWTSANFQQIIGRVHRQGQMAATVDVIIPITQASVGGETWSWCRSRMDRIAYKRSLADAAVDGILPEGRLVSATQAAQAVADWLDRLSTGELHQIERTPLNACLVGTPAGLVQRLVRFGAFASMNARWNSTTSTSTHSRLLGDPGEWFRYHALYREARAAWSIVPADVIAGWLARRKPGQTIADLGCGEMLLANADNGRNTVRGFDHVAADSRVTVCDIASVPLKDASVDIAVLCLSLMGANSGDYLTEARRILYVDGSLWIAETVSHFGGNPDRIRDALSDYGFHVTEVEYSDTFVFVKATRLDTEPVSRPRRLFA